MLQSTLESLLQYIHLAQEVLESKARSFPGCQIESRLFSSYNLLNSSQCSNSILFTLLVQDLFFYGLTQKEGCGLCMIHYRDLLWILAICHLNVMCVIITFKYVCFLFASSCLSLMYNFQNIQSLVRLGAQKKCVVATSCDVINVLRYFLSYLSFYICKLKHT